METLKCCVGGCAATGETLRFFCFPRNSYLRSLWMSFLAPTNPILLELSEEQLLKQCVCQKHFEKTQFYEEGKRIRFSYTCLFTENGIALGEPLSKVEQNEDDTPEMTLVIGRADWYAYVSEAAAAFHIVTQVCVPPVIGGVTLGLVTDVKHMLEDQAREEKDCVASDEIQQVSRYMESRRLLQPAWSVVPLDLRLPVALFNFCTTYFIVLLQFTHLYD